ncbi:MAG: holo-ACP synthase [Actinomycetes bacterium]
MTLAPSSVVGVGTDLVEVGRLRAALDRQPGLATRLFTGTERNYAGRYRDPVPILAARFAAKEAVMKALGVGFTVVRFDEIGVVRADDGQPSLVLCGRAQLRAEEMCVSRWHLSLSHTDLMASAVVVAERT